MSIFAAFSEVRTHAEVRCIHQNQRKKRMPSVITEWHPPVDFKLQFVSIRSRSFHSPLIVMVTSPFPSSSDNSFSDRSTMNPSRV